MDEKHQHLDPGPSLEQTLPACPDPWIVISPLGWGVKDRLLCAAAAAALLWLAVAWAIGWF